MHSKNPRLKRFLYLITFLVFCAFIYSSGIGVALGQKKPKALRDDPNADDKIFCEKDSNDSSYCDHYDAYTQALTAGNSDAAKTARNRMIGLVVYQIETYYDLRKKDRKTKIKWLQTLLDFLEIGAATAITIMNGERAKTVVGAALNGFQGGRTAFNRNFDVLQTQVLINKMNEKRAKLLAEIYKKRGAAEGDYSWDYAKRDLRELLIAGTFNGALDSLVTETGVEAGKAEAELKRVEDQLIVGEVSTEDRVLSRESNTTLVALETSLGAAAAAQSAAALTTLQGIVTELNKDEKLSQLLASNSITPASPGLAIISALRKLRRELTVVNNTGLVNKINKTIIDLGN